MRCLLLDEEQAKLIEELARAGQAMLGARAQRADPEGIISASHKLQQRKLDNIHRQLNGGVFPKYSELGVVHRTIVDRALSYYPDAVTDEEKDMLFQAVVGAMLAAAAERQPPMIARRQL